MAKFTLACLQVSASNDMAANLRTVAALAREAREGGAELIATPENVAFIGGNAAETRAASRLEGEHPAIPHFAALARETGAWLLAGSLHIRLEGEERLANRSYLFAPSGEVAAKVDKVHMFDVDLPSGESYRESRTFRPGDAARLARLPWAVMGLTVCYDLRFPHLYRLLAQAGADILSIPSSFTVPTGEAHWHVLLRARAIETGCFVLAPAQTGSHAGGRKTYGHSLVVAPWGEVLSDAGTGVGVSLAEIDLDRVAEARGRVPSLRHDRPIAPPPPLGASARAAE
ncbi:MAG: carbon-nitrogen hydrolase family protein [Alphaproteobacteria bacterium]|nr:carbon-nitrogen hydrolase family protein [Alphaproteobacteria bacterium]